MKGLALSGERRLSNNKRANPHSQQESVHQPATYGVPTAKYFLNKGTKIFNFHVDMGLNSEYNKENLLEALKLRR